MENVYKVMVNGKCKGEFESLDTATNAYLEEVCHRPASDSIELVKDGKVIM